MVYQQVIKLCNAKGIKPTPLAKAIGISPSNIKRWEEGTSISLDVAEKIANYFDVPVSYLLLPDSENDSQPPEDVDNSELKAFKIAYNSLVAHPDNIASLMVGRDLTDNDITALSDYLECDKEYLIYKTLSDGRDVYNPSQSVKEFILLGILNKLDGDANFKFVQVRISIIIINNLKKKGVEMRDLINLGLSERKIRRLYDSNLPDEKKRGLNTSDIQNIFENFKVSIDYMLTGKQNRV